MVETRASWQRQIAEQGSSSNAGGATNSQRVQETSAPAPSGLGSMGPPPTRQVEGHAASENVGDDDLEALGRHHEPWSPTYLAAAAAREWQKAAERARASGASRLSHRRDVRGLWEREQSPEFFIYEDETATSAIADGSQEVRYNEEPETAMALDAQYVVVWDNNRNDDPAVTDEPQVPATEEEDPDATITDSSLSDVSSMSDDFGDENVDPAGATATPATGRDAADLSRIARAGRVPFAPRAIGIVRVERTASSEAAATSATGGDIAYSIAAAELAVSVATSEASEPAELAELAAPTAAEAADDAPAPVSVSPVGSLDLAREEMNSRANLPYYYRPPVTRRGSMATAEQIRAYLQSARPTHSGPDRSSGHVSTGGLRLPSRGAGRRGTARRGARGGRGGHTSN